jgi:adenosine deaminase/aminodeoxyfutalosine deaminase
MVIMASSSPFAELHIHLEGALDPAMVCAIDPTIGFAEARAQYQFEDFPGFVQAFKWAVMRLREPEHYRLLARRLFEDLAGQGIVYAEVIHSTGINLWRGLPARPIVEALLEEGRRAPLAVRWILDAVRQLGPEHVLQTARFAAEFSGSDVVGFGVGGDERGCSAESIKPAFDLAKQAGLHLTPHAGETSNAENVWGALYLGAERIGHGIRAIEDASLIDELRRRQIPLEICLHSNVVTGAIRSMEEHPALRLLRAGVPITLNTDDPAFFDTTLAREFATARETLGFTAEELEQVRKDAFSFAFAH